jgi:uncharacterized protein (TIGR02145 family)
MQENYRYTGSTYLEEDGVEWTNRGVNGEALHCYFDNLKSNSQKYGSLYNWNIVKNDNFISDGWRVPIEDDWKNLKEYFKDNIEFLSSRFFNIYGGKRDYMSFAYKDDRQYYWSSIEVDEDMAVGIELKKNQIEKELLISDYPKDYGFSIRLVRNK